MRAYSEDLRRKIVEAVERGMPKAQAAHLFGVSLSSVKRYVRIVQQDTRLRRRRCLEDLKGLVRMPKGFSKKTLRNVAGAAVSGVLLHQALRGGCPLGELGGRLRLRTQDTRGQASLDLLDSLYLYHQVEALLRGGDEPLAREEVHRFAERAEVNERERVAYLRSLAVLSEWEGDIRRAIDHLREAQVLAEKIGLPKELWQIQSRIGELYERRGQGGEAREAFSRGGADFEKARGEDRGRKA